MVFHWNLSDSKSLQFSRTRLRILAVLSSAVVWIVSTRPPTSKSSRPFNNPLIIVPNAPITIGSIVTFMFRSFLKFSSKVEVLILLFTFLPIYSVFRRNSKVDNFTDFLGQVLGCAYTICLYGHIEISCTFPSEPPCLPSRVSLYTPSVLICCIRLLCDWSFRLCTA